jgi:Flp pilus assembly protein TadD
MGFWNKLFKQDDKVDYYREGVDLLQASKYHEAVTSFRLALRDTPNDPAALQQIAIAYTKMGVTDEAVRTYRLVLARDPHSPGAHYGLAFLLLREGRPEDAAKHLRAFLDSPPEGEEAHAHIGHARQALSELEPALQGGGGAAGGGSVSPLAAGGPDDEGTETESVEPADGRGVDG